MTEANTLLMEIQEAVGCLYLSDLHSCQMIGKQSRELILAIPIERYSLQEWNEAASYITGNKCCYSSIEEARASITISD